jgi:peroxiredoxin Q/BCP
MTSVLAEGQQAPLFTLPDQHAAERPLSDFLAQGPVVLFFYPAASTPVCTAQACHFRDLAAEFAELGAVRVGISTDSVAKQGNFASRQGFDYPLLSDADGSVAAAFGVKRGLLGALAPTPTLTTRWPTCANAADRMGHGRAQACAASNAALNVLLGRITTSSLSLSGR